MTANRSSALTLPVLGALGVIVGVWAQRGGVALWMVLAAYAISSVAVLLSKLEVRVAVFAALLLCPLAWWRADFVATTPDALDGTVGQTVTLEGDFDGQFLNATGTRVLVQPRSALTSGRYRVTGRVQLPTWYRNPGAFDLGAWLEGRGVRYAFRVQKAERLPDSWLEAVRQHARAGIQAGLAPREAALMLGVALGNADDFSRLPDTPEGLSWREVFSRSGLTHVMALSGQQISILVWALSIVFAFLKTARYPLLIAVLVGYWFVVGASPSVTRAVIMGVAVLVTLWAGRGRLEVLPALGLSALVTLLVEPRWLFDLGFQLSYLAVLGMYLFIAPALKLLPRASKPMRYLVAGAAATLGASALTLPLTASSFGLVAPLSPFPNLIAEALMQGLVPLGFLTAILGPTLSPVVNLLTGVLAWLLLETARLFAAAPVLEWARIGPVGIVAYYASALAVLLVLNGRLRPRVGLLVPLAAVLLTGALSRAPHHEIVYLDVGQGDSTLIRLPGVDILVDGGGTPRSDFDIGKRVVVPALRALGVRNLIVVATHADSDHIEGLNAVLERGGVGTLVIGHDKAPGEDAFWDDLKATAARKGVKLREVRRGEVWRFGDAALRFWGPRADTLPEDNQNSVAFTLEASGRRYLFLGDTPGELEAEMNPGKLEILKAAHHGSRFSTSEILMQRTTPRAAVVSSGADNTYGHPSRTVLQRLERYGTRIYRTDRDGAITVNLSTGAITAMNPNPATGLPGPPGRTRSSAP
jgi:competence protein ComEC